MVTTELPATQRMVVAVPWSNEEHARPVADIRLFINHLTAMGVLFDDMFINPETWELMKKTAEYSLHSPVTYPPLLIRDKVPDGFVQFVRRGEVVAFIRTK